MAGLISIEQSVQVIGIPNVAEWTILNEDGTGNLTLWYSPSTGIVNATPALTTEQAAAIQELTAINWAQLLKNIEALLAIIAPLIQPEASTKVVHRAAGIIVGVGTPLPQSTPSMIPAAKEQRPWGSKRVGEVNPGGSPEHAGLAQAHDGEPSLVNVFAGG